jgi:CDP-diglyceride synthetase
VGALVLFAPPWFFTIFIAVAGLWGLYEVAAMTGALHWVAVPLFATVGGVPLFALLYGGNLGVVGWAVPVIVIVMMLGLAVRIEIARGGERFRGPRLVFMGAAYVGFLFPFFALLRNSPNGIYILLLVILLAVVSDSGAYFIGRYMGKTKLAPSVSPNKTVDGRNVGHGLCVAIFGYCLHPCAAWRSGRLCAEARRGCERLGLDFSRAWRTARSNLFPSVHGVFRLLLVLMMRLWWPHFHARTHSGSDLRAGTK